VAREEEEEDLPKSTAFPPLLTFGNDKSLFQPGITLLVSYPRSGNTLLRSLLEGITGIVTSSDTRPDRALSQALAEQHGLVGEGLCRPPLCKTHWPERIGCQQFEARRAILVVRNPFDAIVDSYWNLNVTNTHTEKVTDEVYEQFQDFFQDLVRNETKVWLDFLDFWYHQGTKIPLLVVRYEDLIRSPRSELERILEFYTTGGAEEWKTRLDTVLSQQRPHHGYQQQSSSKNNSNPSIIGRSITRGRYPPDLLETLHQMDKQQNGWLERFGYHVLNNNNPEGLFPKNMMEESLLPSSSPPPQKEIITEKSSSSTTTMTINQPDIDLRPRNCPYGRNMRTWRRAHTMDDTRPFPTVTSSKR
jgi:hypothetical protein